MKTKQGNDVIDIIGVTYAEKKKKTKLSWPIGSSVDCDEN